MYLTKRKDYIYVSVFFTYVIILFMITMYIIFFKNYFSIPDCIIYRYFGVFCPACGGTRAIISLFNLKIKESIFYNPVVIYSLTVSTIYLLVETVNRIFNKNINISWNIFIFFGLILLTVNCILQNTVLHIL